MLCEVSCHIFTPMLTEVMEGHGLEEVRNRVRSYLIYVRVVNELKGLLVV